MAPDISSRQDEVQVISADGLDHARLPHVLSIARDADTLLVHTLPVGRYRVSLDDRTAEADIRDGETTRVRLVPSTP